MILIRCIARLTLLSRYKENIVQNPPVVPLKRSEINNPVYEAPPEGFALKSGRVIRTVDAATPLMYRTWKPPVLQNRERKLDAVLKFLTVCRRGNLHNKNLWGSSGCIVSLWSTEAGNPGC
ncbi:uncharacterized protein LOC124358721 [Homalodisca vitripennis]|uniref:uncharacterized protein LOC124358721 n=1 Tax=Homalodisca vitripennis TaxID=197043 RepID=UPI001EEB5356|nr:uncharacterized protein LOC124358721 [Homalodisca vitripennis]